MAVGARATDHRGSPSGSLQRGRRRCGTQQPERLEVACRAAECRRDGLSTYRRRPGAHRFRPDGAARLGRRLGRGGEVVAAAKAHLPGVALPDIEMLGTDGLAVASGLAEQILSCRAFILTNFGRPGYLRHAMESGTASLVAKTFLLGCWSTRSVGWLLANVSSIRCSPP